MTNSHKSQSEKLAAGGGRETAAKKLKHNRPEEVPLDLGRANEGKRLCGRARVSPDSCPACSGARRACSDGAALSAVCFQRDSSRVGRLGKAFEVGMVWGLGFRV